MNIYGSFILLTILTAYCNSGFSAETLTLSQLQSMVGSDLAKKVTTSISKNEFLKALDASVSVSRKFQTVAPWIGSYSTASDYQPFAQKLIVSSQSCCVFFGDLHGNIHSLLRLLNTFVDDNFKIKSKATYLIFLGDYVDRGTSGVEVLYALMRLKCQNPFNVFLVRGNHEDCRLNASFGFYKEIMQKFGSIDEEFKTRLNHFYNSLPVALYLGCRNEKEVNFIQCCHGGLEIGYNPKNLLKTSGSCAFESIEKLERTMPVRILPKELKQEIIHQVPEHEIVDCVCKAPTSPVTNGFMWSDFIVSNNDAIIDYHNGRGWVFGEKLTKYLLNQYSNGHFRLRGIFRAHQHHGDMLSLLKAHKGLVNLWDGVVYTFLSAPIDGLDFPYDAVGILKTAENFEEWKLAQLVLPVSE